MDAVDASANQTIYVNDTANILNESDLDFLEEGFLCKNDLPLLRFIFGVVITLSVVVLGFIGNCLVFAVLCRQRLRITTNLMLQSLAIADNIVLVITVLSALDIIQRCTLDDKGYRHWNANKWSFIFVVVYPCLYAVRMIGTWLTTLLTVERWMAVCYPRRKPFLGSKYAAAVCKIITVVVCAILVSLPRFFEFRLVQKYGRRKVGTADLFSNKTYTFVYKISLFFLWMYLIPMVVMVVFNSKLFIALRRGQGDTRIGRSATMVVVIIVLIFLLCNIPPLISHLLWSLEIAIPSMDYLEEGRRHLAIVSNVMVVINCSVNFLVYFVCSKSFRNTLKAMFSCRYADDKTGQSVNTYESSASGEKIELSNIRDK